MELEDAKRVHQTEWGYKTSKYSLSRSDSFTDGFWAGRLWAAGRLLEAFSGLDRDRVVELLSIYPREAHGEGI
jgi:hypothetical protein